MTFSKEEIGLRAPAKINLVLKILHRLPNGYHALWSIMQTVELEDELTMCLAPASAGIQLRCEEPGLSENSDNLVYRAAERVIKRSGIRVGLMMTLKKRIPMAAGLGGGSSDAASTIAGLNHLLGLGWSAEMLGNIGAELGSDISFFFFSPTAVVSGWGQEVAPFRLEGTRWIVLINPGFPISTKFAYNQLAASRSTHPSLPQSFQLVGQSEKMTWEDLMPMMENDFETALYPVYPVLADLKSALSAEGAETALLSGSGATVFGVFQDYSTALKAKERIIDRFPVTSFIVRSISCPFWDFVLKK